MKNLKEISKVFYKFDPMYLAVHGCPEDEYDDWAQQLLDRLEFEENIRIPFPNLPDDSPCYRFNKFQIAEQIGRVYDFYYNLEGSILPIYKNMKVFKYTEPMLNPSKRSDFFNMAEKIIEILYGKN